MESYIVLNCKNMESYLVLNCNNMESYIVLNCNNMESYIVLNCNNMESYIVLNCYSNYYVNIGDPTVHLTTLLIGSLFFEGLKMTRWESKHVAHVSMVVDIPISCCVRLLHLVPMLHNEELYNFYSSLNNIHMMKSRRIWWEEKVARLVNVEIYILKKEI